MSVSADGTGDVGVGGAGNGGDGDEDEENTCYSWTRGDSDIMYRSNQKNLGNNGNSSNIAASRTGSGKVVSGALPKILEGAAIGGGGVGGHDEAPASTVVVKAAEAAARLPVPGQRVLTLEAAGRLRASDVYFPAAGGKAEGAATTGRAMDGNGSSYTSSSTTATMGSATADGASEATGDLTTAALAAVEALAQDLFVPGVSKYPFRYVGESSSAVSCQHHFLLHDFMNFLVRHVFLVVFYERKREGPRGVFGGGRAGQDGVGQQG